MRHKTYKISLLLIGLIILYFWSFSYQEQKKLNSFLTKVNQTRVYNDPLIDEIYQDFLRISGFNIEGQDSTIKLVEFPYVFDWRSEYIGESNLDNLNDLMGLAVGMWDDSKIEVYINHSDWTLLDQKSKRKLLYHELLHDCFNLEHVDSSCDIMFKRLNSCINNNLDDNLSRILKLALHNDDKKNIENITKMITEEMLLSGYSGKGTIIYLDGGKYAGEFKEGLFDGKGTYSWASGSKYIGEWKDNASNGQGTYTYFHGDKYIGEWKDSKKNGYGAYTYANGDKYIGEYKMNKIHGQGNFTFANGDNYLGEFKNDKRDGYGVYTNAKGDKYEGEWRNGKQNSQ